jgi:hypothetical protein
VLTQSDVNGIFRFLHLEPGEREVSIETRGHVPRESRVVVGVTSNPAEIRLTCGRNGGSSPGDALEVQSNVGGRRENGPKRHPRGMSDERRLPRRWHCCRRELDLLALVMGSSESRRIARSIESPRRYQRSSFGPIRF